MHFSQKVLKLLNRKFVDMLQISVHIFPNQVFDDSMKNNEFFW